MKRHIRRNEPMRWRMREERTRRGLTLRDVGKMTNYSFGTIHRAERGKLYVGGKSDKRRDEFWSAMSEFYSTPRAELERVETR